MIIMIIIIITITMIIMIIIKIMLMMIITRSRMLERWKAISGSSPPPDEVYGKQSFWTYKLQNSLSACSWPTAHLKLIRPVS